MKRQEAERELKKEFEKKEPDEKSLAILQDPNLFKILSRELSKKIVGEISTKRVILLCCFGRLVENCQTASFNLLVNSESGSGKDYITSKVLEILPKEHYIKKTRISPAVFTYWHNSQFEPDWTWDGKVFYAEDISEGILNSDVFKVMCSSGSSATIVIRQRAIDLEIIGKPVMITTTASASPNPEMTRRFVMLTLDESVDQTKAIMQRQSEFKKKGISPEYNQDLIEAQKFLKRYKVKIPFAHLIHEHFPKENIIMRTNYLRFLDFICASACLHQYQRKREGEDFILAEGQDYEIARQCFLKLFSNRFMIPLTRNQKEILRYFEDNPTLEGSVSELYNTYGINFISDRSLETNLKLLVKNSILKITTKKDVLNRDVASYSLKRGHIQNETLNIPEFASISSLSSFTSLSSVSSISPLVIEDSEDKEAIKGINRVENWSENDKKRLKFAKGEISRAKLEEGVKK